MTTDEMVDSGPISDEEVAALAEQLRSTVNIEELKSKNSAVLTVTMPFPLRVMIDERVGNDSSAADWARQMIADALGYTLTQAPKRQKANARQKELEQKANRKMVADLVEAARKGEINL